MQAALALVQEVKHGTTRGGEAVVESDAAFRDIGLAVERLAGGVTTIESTAEVVTRAVDQAATAIGALTSTAERSAETAGEVSALADSAGHLVLEREAGIQVVDVDCAAAAAR